MSEMFSFVPDWLIRTTLFMAVGAVLVQCLLSVGRVRSTWMHRAGWMFVLLQGVLILQYSLEIPWYTSEPAAAATEPWDAAFADYPMTGADQPLGLRSTTVMSALVADETRAAKSTSLLVGRILRVTWIVGIVGVLGVATTSYALLLLVLRRAESAPRNWQGEWNRLLRQAGIRSHVPLLVSQSLGPMLCLRPSGHCVVVPQTQWKELSSAQRISILRHELAHLKRGDVWKSLIVRAVATVHWFNPLAWLAVRRFEEAAEWACDQQLAKADPRSVPEYARALLQLVAPTPTNLGASAAQGASVSTRLKRLLVLQNSGDSIMKRSIFTLALLALGTAGILRLQLVAQETAAESNVVVGETRISEFVNKLHGDSEVLDEFRKVVKTPAGKVALEDRASYFESQKLDELRGKAVPMYFEEHFTKDGDKIRLSSGQDAYRADLMKAAKEVNADLESIKPALQSLAKQFEPKSDLDKLVVRFLNSDASAALIYMKELRKRLRPNESAIEYALRDLLVRDDKGKFTIRPANRAKAEEMLTTSKQLVAAMTQIKTELAVFSKDIAAKDDLNRRLKQVTGESLFSAFVLAQLMEEGGGDARRKLDKFLDSLDQVFVEAADGLVVIDSQREELSGLLKKYDLVKKHVASIRKPLKAFSRDINPIDELNKGWAELLQTDVACMKLAEQLGEYSDASVEDIVRDLLNEVLEEDDNGKLHVAEGKEDDINEAIQEGFRGYRSLQRKTRPIDNVAERLEDREFAAAIGSIGGKLYVVEAIKRKVEGMEFDGFQAWIDENFDQVDDGWKLKADAQEELRAIVDRAAQIAKELSKDDF